MLTGLKQKDAVYRQDLQDRLRLVEGENSGLEMQMVRALSLNIFCFQFQGPV
jgi:hypothetical protein